MICEKLLNIVDHLSAECEKLNFSAPVSHVYDPLEYAREGVKRYIDLYGASTKKVVFIGMNPGPFGMAQTGVPFGEIDMVKNWLGIEVPIGKPANEHPKRPIMGFDCHRSEVSGRRIWGLFKEKFGSAENFFKNHFVWRYYFYLLFYKCLFINS